MRTFGKLCANTLFMLIGFSAMAGEVPTILAFGDSITEGGRNAVSYRKVLIPELRKKNLSFKFIGPKKDASSAHAGYSGKSTKSLRKVAEEVYKQYPADIVLFHSGHNSFSKDKPVPGILEDTEAIIDSFWKINPKVKILLAQVIPAGKLPKYSYIPELNKELPSLAKRLKEKGVSITLVNLADGFDWEKDTIGDRVHPNAAGAKKMADKWMTALLPLLDKEAAGPVGDNIPKAELEALRQELARLSGGMSSVEIRRTCKGVIRKAQAFLGSAPDAPNSYDAVALLLAGQKRLLSLEGTDANREALYETCSNLSEAPDDYAEVRLDADLILNEKEMTEKNATVAERAKALEGILKKYRGTVAECRCLIIAAAISAKLQAFDLNEQIMKSLATGLMAGDHKSIEFRRKTQTLIRQDVVFSGTYRTVEGTTMTFPYDRLGHQYLIMLWSKESSDCESFLGSVRELQERCPGRFEVYSLNLDNLPDAGHSILAKAGIEGIALHLPGGRASSAYKAYGIMDPMAVLVNGQGRACLQKGVSVPRTEESIRRGHIEATPPLLVDDRRYLAQLRSLFIGDFLVGAGDAAGIDDELLKAELEKIQQCFVLPPFRYRLTHEEELANYSKAEKLCTAVIKSRPEEANLWMVRNRRIIALMGLWNVARKPQHLEEAVKEAQAVLSMGLPADRCVAARFCLATDKMRKGDPDLEALIGELTGDDPSAAALASAAILAIEASDHDLYRAYRSSFLSTCKEDDSSLWLPLSFMRDRQHDYRLFWANPGRWGFTRKQRYYVKYVISGLWGLPEKGRVFKATLNGLDGQKLTFPEQTQGKMRGVIFAEIPKDESDRSALIDRVNGYARKFSTNGVPVTVAFLSDGVDEVRASVGGLADECQPAIVPEGLKNPLVRQLGILSADRIPNPYLLNGDGTIMWSISGLDYSIEYGSKVANIISDSIAINIEKVRTDRAFDALEQGDFKQALSLFDERVPPKMDKDAWTHDRHHGRALAYMGLKDWLAALAAIDAASAARGSNTRWGRRDDEGVVEQYRVRSVILEKLGRSEEASEAANLAEETAAWLKTAPFFWPPSYARSGIPVGVYTDILKKVRLSLEKAQQPDDEGEKQK